MADLLQCYNKGCGQKFDPDNNGGVSDPCQHHPGEPIFHDAKKKWSCCKKFSTDFSEFLSIKGCTNGKHSNVRPVEPTQQKPTTTFEATDNSPKTVPVQPAHTPIFVPLPRPDATEPMKPLSVEIAPSLKTLLSKMTSDKEPNTASNGDDATQIDSTAKIPAGTACKNSGCKSTYTSIAADSELCLYHPGVPIFHEGKLISGKEVVKRLLISFSPFFFPGLSMKYWTCCNRKTSEFDSFIDQVGCATGRHNWTEKAAQATNLVLSLAAKSACRHDWFQLPGNVTLSIYAKAVRPSSARITANQVRLGVTFSYGSDGQSFDRTFELYGLINPDACKVKLMGAKVEIVLQKAEPLSWPRLELITPIAAVAGDEADKAIAT